MIAGQAYKDYPKLTETETIITDLIMKSPNGIHINNIIKKYPGRNFAVRNALQRLEAFKIAFCKNFVWFIEPQFQMEFSKKHPMRQMEKAKTSCLRTIEKSFGNNDKDNSSSSSKNNTLIHIFSGVD